MERRILHIDMDAFFASVEQVLDPSLKGKALIIGGDRGDTRGVVSTASYEARKYGVHSAMPLAQARRLCPHGIFMRGNFEHYRAASEKVRGILDTVSPVVECVSIDEAYIDITGSRRLFGGEDALAAYLKSAIRDQTQLPCSLAIGSNKLVAKVGSDEAKPDGYLNIPTGEERAFLRPMPVKKLPGVGPRTCERLESRGMMTVGCLAEAPLDALISVVGKWGYALHQAACGIASSELRPELLPKSIGRETTFERDLLDWDHIGRVLAYLSERTAYSLREKEMEARCVTLKVRYADFKTNTFAKTLPEPTCIDADIVKALAELVPKARQRRARVRLIGVSLSSLTYNQHQLYLFNRKDTEKWERALESVDQVRERHGFELLRFARSMGRKRA